MSQAKLLLIDDDVELAELLHEYLESEGLLLEHRDRGENGLSELKANQYDLVLLDIMMPGMSGLDVLKDLRQWSKIPVLMLTAKGDEFDKVMGLELGADDYLPKPYSHRELLARIKALLRRVAMDTSTDDGKAFTYGPLRLDLDLYCAFLQEQDLELTQTEFNTLLVLSEAAGKVVKKEDLYQKVLGRKVAAFDRSIDMHVSNIRKKFAAIDESYNPIKTQRGIGYIFTGQS
jgi:two-component system response regulator CpxR